MVVNAHTSWWRTFRRRESPVAEVRLGRDRPSRTSTSTTGSGAPAWRCRADQRVAVVLRYYEHRDYAEIADLTGVREGTVRSRVSRGLATLRPSWAPSWRTTMSDLETRLSEGLAGTAERAPHPDRPRPPGPVCRLRRRRRTTTAVVAAALAVVAIPVGLTVVGGEAAGGGPDGRDPTTVAEASRRLADRDLARPLASSVPPEWAFGGGTSWCTAGSLERGRRPGQSTRRGDPGHRVPAVVRLRCALLPAERRRAAAGHRGGGAAVPRHRYPDGAWIGYVAHRAGGGVGRDRRPHHHPAGARLGRRRSGEVDANGCATRVEMTAPTTSEPAVGVPLRPERAGSSRASCCRRPTVPRLAAPSPRPPARRARRAPWPARS